MNTAHLNSKNLIVESNEIKTYSQDAKQSGELSVVNTIYNESKLSSVSCLTNEKIKQFEELRLNYCQSAFERQIVALQDLDKKSQWLFTFSTAILASLFFKYEYIKEVVNSFSRLGVSHDSVVVGIGALFVLGLSCFVNLLFILLCSRVRPFKTGHPEDMTKSLFSPESDIGVVSSNLLLINRMAMYYSVAVDDNSIIIKRKSNYLKHAYHVAVVSMIAFAVFIYISFSLQMP